MPGNAYLDFDLRFRKERSGYRVEIIQSPGGHAEHRFKLPFSEMELENYMLKIGRRHSGVRSATSPETKAARDFGTKLFDTVFQDEVQACFSRSLEEAKRRNSGLRLRLHLEQTPELADLPWEYLYHSQPRQFLALSAETPVVRYLDLPQERQPLAVVPPLRALVMISNPSDYEPLDVEREWQNLRSAVKDLEARGLLVVERLERATLEQLQRQLRKADYHIFHFVGHGGFDPNTQEGVLVLEDDAGRGRMVSGSDVGVYLRDEPTLRLVLLNACEGGRCARNDAFAGAAQSLVLKNIPAVIAMQFEVSDDAAIVLAGGFYSALADGYAVDAALAEARKAVFARGNAIEWGTPVLYLRAPDGRIFNVDKTNTNFISAPKTAELLRVAEAAFSAEDWPTAVAKFEAVLAIDPKNSAARARLSEVNDAKSLADSYDQAVRCADTGRWREALEIFERVHRAKAYFRNVATRIAEARRHLEPAQKPPTIPPAGKRRPEPQPVIRSTPAVLPPVVPPVSKPVVPAIPTSRPNRTWIWVSVVAAVFIVLSLVGLGIWQAVQEDEDADIPAWQNNWTGNQPAPIAPNAPRAVGSPAGRSFDPSGWWIMQVTGGLNVRNRIYFTADNRFSGTANTALGALPVTGTWFYEPGSSMLRLNFSTGDWVYVQLFTAQEGFSASLTQGFLQYHYQFTKEQ